VINEFSLVPRLQILYDDVGYQTVAVIS